MLELNPTESSLTQEDVSSSIQVKQDHREPSGLYHRIRENRGGGGDAPPDPSRNNITFGLRLFFKELK